MPDERTALLLTAEEYYALPEETPSHQLVEGELIMAPAPNRYHQTISHNIELLLGNFLRQNPLGKVYDAPFDVELDEHNVFQPDKVFVSKARESILTDHGARGAPDLVIEILSPSSAALDRQRKRKVYARTGVEELWFIDPDARRVEVYRLQDDAERAAALYYEDDSFESAVLPGLAISVREVFAA
jgi:Uma2 family endonuclease